MTPVGLGQAVFSPDGEWYARFNWHGFTNNSFSTFDLYPFDRCSGLLGSPVSKTYSSNGKEGKPGGIAFSGNSRYLYVSRWDSIFQYDLHAPDILASEAVVAVYDGFRADYDLPTRFFTLLLAPDNKIYGSVSNYNSRYLHVIEKPDLPGQACEVRQHAIRLPVFNNNLLPNVPYYRLWDWEGSPCDTLGVNSASSALRSPVERLRVYPNPAQGAVQVEFAAAATGGDLGLWVLDLTGRVVDRKLLPQGATQGTLLLEARPPGLYEVQLRGGGRVLGVGKVAVMR